MFHRVWTLSLIIGFCSFAPYSYGQDAPAAAPSIPAPTAPSPKSTPVFVGDPSAPAKVVIRDEDLTVFDWALSPELFRKLWNGSVELGLNGATGNSENFKLRTAIAAKRETAARIFQFDFLYSYATLNGTASEDRSMTKVRNEWLMPESPWSAFWSGAVETDTFKAFDVRISTHAGLAYLFLKNDVTMLKGRFGAGMSREIGGPDNTVHPELLFGVDFSHKLTDRQTITANVDVFPNVQNFSDYRAEIRAAWEILVDPTWNLTLKLGLLDRYDSTPQGRRPNDLEYFAVIMWKY